MANHGPFASVWESLLPSLVLFLDFFRKQVGAEHYLEDPSNPNKGQLETFQEVSITTNHWSCFIPLLRGRVTGVVITMESKMVTPWCSLPKSQMGLCHHDSSLALSGLQSSPAKGPVPTQEDQYFHDLCTKGLLIPRVTFSLCSKFPANSRKPLLFYLISLAALLIFSSNLKSLSTTLMQKQTYDYLRRKRSQITPSESLFAVLHDFWLFHPPHIQHWLLHKGLLGFTNVLQHNKAVMAKPRHSLLGSTNHGWLLELYIL